MSLRWLTFSSVALVALGIALLGYYATNRVDAKLGHRDGIEAFRAAQAAAAPTEAEPDALVDPAPSAPVETTTPATLDLESLGEPDKTLWSDKRIADYEKFATEAAGDIPEGILRIPSIDLELPVFDNSAEPALTRGAGWIEGTAPLGVDGNIGIAAHRDGYFRALKDVSKGDEVIVETLWGTDRYRIVDVIIVDPSDVHVLHDDGRSLVTLVTCYPFYHVGNAPQRYIVQAQKL